MRGSEFDAKLIREFTFFAGMCENVAPLYAALSARVAEDAWVRGLSIPEAAPEVGNVVAAKTRERNPPANMLFGAVQYLLLGGAEHPLKDYYPSIVGAEMARSPDDAWPHFADFCRIHEAAIRDLVATRWVQTNEVGRCGVLLPGLEVAAQMFTATCGGRDAHPSLYLIELGPSAGLNLLFDRYRYEYSNGATCGDASSPVIVSTEVRGDTTPPIPGSLPRVAGRIGVDRSPVDVTDAEQMRWIQSLIWADDVDRHNNLHQAVKLAQHDPPRIVAGDGLNVVPRLVAESPADAVPVVFHSHAIYQMPESWRTEFDCMLKSLGSSRDFVHLSLEWLGDDPGPIMHLTQWNGGKRTQFRLARAYHHGRWIEWDGSPLTVASSY